MKRNNINTRNSMVDDINTLLPYDYAISIGVTLFTGKYYIKMWKYDPILGVLDCIMNITYKNTTQLYIALEAILKFYTRATQFKT